MRQGGSTSGGCALHAQHTPGAHTLVGFLCSHAHSKLSARASPCPQFLAAEGRYVYTTPKSYLELLKLFTSLLEKKHVEADAAIQRLEGGVLKLAQSAQAVTDLEENLKVG